MTDQTLERFWDKVEVDEVTGCWNWQGAKDKDKYGRFPLTHTKLMSAHRFSFQVNKGSIPIGLVLDHLCKNPSCVNPDHLEPVTQKENIARSPSFNKSKTHCPKGHIYQGNNVFFDKKNRRYCRECSRIHAREQRAAKNAQKPV